MFVAMEKRCFLKLSLKARRLSFNSDERALRDSKNSCYIFGDGPSIRYLDYEDFLDRPVISCGNQLFHKQHRLLHSAAYVVIEPWLFYPRWLLKLTGKVNLAAHSELTRRYITYFDDEDTPDFYINYNNMPVTWGKYYYLSKNTFLSDSKFFDLYKAGINPISGSFIATISLAIKLGFTDICLVGFDAFMLHASPLRWYSQGSDDPLLIRRDISLDSNTALQVFGQMANVQILSFSETNGDSRFLSYHDRRSDDISPRNFREIIDYDDLMLLQTTYS
jgi:hypothetical protein